MHDEDKFARCDAAIQEFESVIDWFESDVMMDPFLGFPRVILSKMRNDLMYLSTLLSDAHRCSLDANLRRIENEKTIVTRLETALIRELSSPTMDIRTRYFHPHLTDIHRSIVCNGVIPKVNEFDTTFSRICKDYDTVKIAMLAIWRAHPVRPHACDWESWYPSLERIWHALLDMQTSIPSKAMHDANSSKLNAEIRKCRRAKANIIKTIAIYRRHVATLAIQRAWLAYAYNPASKIGYARMLAAMSQCMFGFEEPNTICV